MVERSVVIKLQHCDFYTHKDIQCAPKEEADKFLSKLTFDWKVTDNFIDFDEPNTERAVKAEVVEIGRFHAKNFPNVKALVTVSLKPVIGKFYDNWMSIGLFSSDVEDEFIEYIDLLSLQSQSDYSFGFVTQL